MDVWRSDRLPTPVFLGFPCGSAGKESACNAGDLDSIPGLGRSPGEGKGYPKTKLPKLNDTELENVGTDVFQSCDHCWIFQVRWHIECSTFTASSFRIWNSSVGISSSPLALFTVMLPKAHLTSHSGCLALGEWSHHHGYHQITYDITYM